MGILLWLPSIALSFQPADNVWLGSEPSRIQHYNIERQYQVCVTGKSGKTLKMA